MVLAQSVSRCSSYGSYETAYLEIEQVVLASPRRLVFQRNMLTRRTHKLCNCDE